MLKNGYISIIEIPSYIFPYGKKDYDKVIRHKKIRHLTRTELVFYYFYCETFHFLGSMLLCFMFIYLLKTGGAAKNLILALGAFILIQEFYLHPKMFQQTYYKSFLDSTSWLIPIIFFLYK